MSNQYGLGMSGGFSAPSDQSSPYIIIAIDFGTTYSGVAWAFSFNVTETGSRIVQDWRTVLTLAADNAKVPTVIHYDSSGRYTWGLEVPPNSQPLRWFKLLLMDEKDISANPSLKNSSHLRNAREQLRRSGKSATEVTADYLRGLWNHALTSIAKEIGSEAMMESYHIRVVLTHPAIWSHNASARTKMAAELAGITATRISGVPTLDLVPEPEAAALANLHEFQHRPDIRSGDIFVVCDAGGGTVDLISYRVETTDPITVAEYVPGKGKCCGAIFVDAKFLEWIKGAAGAQRWEKLSTADIKKMMDEQWENGIKKNFEGPGRNFAIPLPAAAFAARLGHGGYNDKRHGIENGAVKVPGDAVEMFFEHSVSEIQALVNDQIKAVKEKSGGKLPKGIILVGGFGQSAFLYHRLKEEHKGKNIAVLQGRGNRPWTAICRGALTKGLTRGTPEAAHQPGIVSRVSRHNYGTTYFTDFIEGIHDPRDKHWDEKRLKDVAVQQIHWYLRKGQDVLDQVPVCSTYDQLLDYRKPPTAAGVTLYMSAADSAAERLDRDTSKLCEISFPLEVDKLPIYSNSRGQHFKQVKYVLKMMYNGSSLDWTVVVNGREQAKKTVSIEFAS